MKKTPSGPEHVVGSLQTRDTHQFCGEEFCDRSWNVGSAAEVEDIEQCHKPQVAAGSPH